MYASLCTVHHSPTSTAFDFAFARVAFLALPCLAAVPACLARSLVQLQAQLMGAGGMYAKTATDTDMVSVSDLHLFCICPTLALG